MVLVLLARGALEKDEALSALDALRPHISEEQYAVAFMRLNLNLEGAP